MFAHGTVIGVSRYLPVLGYVRGAPERAFFVGNPLEAVQQAARTAIAPGRLGHDIFAAAEAAREQCPDAGKLDFLAHGMGLISHEVPRLTSSGPVAYTADHADRPLEAGMVLSVETDLRDPDVGFVKLEDTIVVTEDGYEALADGLRGWNLAGA